MARVKRGTTAKARHNKIISMAKGYRGRSKNCFRTAIQSVEKGLQYQYRDRRTRKRDFRRLWIQRINAAARIYGLRYSEFMHGLQLADINIDRKMLAELAVNNADAFQAIAEQASGALKKAA